MAFVWPWAQTLHNDMLSMITDAANVLAERHLEHHRPHDAMWAIQQGCLAVPDHEHLAARNIHALALLGDRSGVEREIRRLTRQARAAGRDLSTQTTLRVQHALHHSLTSA